MSEQPRAIPFDRLGIGDIDEVGGKNASLGEMIRELAGTGVRVPGGFATTAFAFREFLSLNRLDQRIRDRLAGLDIDDVASLARAGAEIRRWMTEAPLPPALRAAIADAFVKLTADAPAASWAVRSSATAEDLPGASFAGQQETFLNINGIDNILHAISEVFASLYNDRAIAYRVHHGFAHEHVALSAGVQRMVRSDLGASGVMFTLDTESGFDQVVFITASYGLGETVVQGSVNPDEFYVTNRTPPGATPILQDGGAKASRCSAKPACRMLDDSRVLRRAPGLFDQRCRGKSSRTRGRHQRGRDGHPKGRRHRWSPLHRAGPPGNGAIEGRWREAPALSAASEIHGPGERPRDRPEDRAGCGAARQVRFRDGQGARG
jgi:hypothetical protein